VTSEKSSRVTISKSDMGTSWKAVLR